MKMAWKIIAIVLGLSVVAFVEYKGYERYFEREAEKTATQEESAALRVACAKVKTGDVREVTVLTGTVRAMGILGPQGGDRAVPKTSAVRAGAS